MSGNSLSKFSPEVISAAKDVKHYKSAAMIGLLKLIPAAFTLLFIGISGTFQQYHDKIVKIAPKFFAFIYKNFPHQTPIFVLSVGLITAILGLMTARKLRKAEEKLSSRGCFVVNDEQKKTWLFFKNDGFTL